MLFIYSNIAHFSWWTTKSAILLIEIFIKRFDAPDLLLYLLSFLNNLALLIIHSLVHLLELLLFSLKFGILSLHYLLMLVQKLSHIVKLFISQDLELFEVGCDLIRRRNSTHLGDACL